MNTGKEVKTKMRKLIALIMVVLFAMTMTAVYADVEWTVYGADGGTLSPAGSGDDWFSFSMGDRENRTNGRISHIIGGTEGTSSWVFDENCYQVGLRLEGFNEDYDFEAAGMNVYLGILGYTAPDAPESYYEANLGTLRNGDYVVDFGEFEHVFGPQSPHINGVELVIGFGDSYYTPGDNPAAGRKYITYPMVAANGQYEAHTFYVKNVSTEMVPEPATYAYAAMGLVSVLGLKRRIKK